MWQAEKAKWRAALGATKYQWRLVQHAWLWRRAWFFLVAPAMVIMYRGQMIERPMDWVQRNVDGLLFCVDSNKVRHKRASYLDWDNAMFEYAPIRYQLWDYGAQAARWMMAIPFFVCLSLPIAIPALLAIRYVAAHLTLGWR